MWISVLVTELKRGLIEEDAITQTLAYAAEYSRMTADELASLYCERGGTTGLVTKVNSNEEARIKLSDHVGEHILNESQVLLLVGEEFSGGP